MSAGGRQGSLLSGEMGNVRRVRTAVKEGQAAMGAAEGERGHRQRSPIKGI